MATGFLTNIILEIVQSPINLALVLLIIFLVYKIIRSRRNDTSLPPPPPELPKLKKRDFTVEELRKYDGNGEDGRVLVAVNGNVYDVTKGKRFYGPGKVLLIKFGLSGSTQSDVILLDMHDDLAFISW